MPESSGLHFAAPNRVPSSSLVQTDTPHVRSTTSIDRASRTASSSRHGRRHRRRTTAALPYPPSNGQSGLDGISETAEANSNRPTDIDAAHDTAPRRQRLPHISPYGRPTHERRSHLNASNGDRPAPTEHARRRVLPANPSLASLLSTLTGFSERSSGSNSTVTQQSYNKTVAEVVETLANTNVFDYMMPSSRTAAYNVTRSSQKASPASSTYAASDGAFSDGLGTPSSRSTAPSPTDLRFEKMKRTSRGRRQRSTSITSSTRGNGNSSGSSNDSSPDDARRSRRSPPSRAASVEEDSEDADDQDDGDRTHESSGSDDDEEAHHVESTEDRRSSRHLPAAPNVPSRSQASNDSHDSDVSQRSRRLHYHAAPPADQLLLQEELRRQHMAYAADAHARGPTMNDSIRSQSVSSSESHSAAQAWETAMQYYQKHSSTSPQSSVHSTGLPCEPYVPDSPNLSQTTLTGYEKIALELSSGGGSVKPLYRRFEYLNHRILLHLQDELSELEEQLRVVDEVIAQLEAGPSDAAPRTPASRRGETYSASEIHHRRIHLLGRIFQKSEQYNRAMSAYASVCRESSAAEDAQVEAYRLWMTQNAPIHELETRYLRHDKDLIVLRTKSATASTLPSSESDRSNSEPAIPHAALMYMPVALMLPMLLYSVVPGIVGRLAVTMLFAAAAFLVASSTAIRHFMSAREWAICGTAYILLMGAVAGCIPSR